MQALRGIIIPCYNEAYRIEQETYGEFVAANKCYHLCFVNDGSTDDSAAVLGAFCAHYPEQMTLINLPTNRGKGEAVRSGLNTLKKQNRFETIGFLDADLATPLHEFDRLNTLLIGSSYGAVFGSRMKKMGSRIDRSLRRHIIGRFFATLISLTIRLPFYDTQCGAKVFKSAFLDGITDEEFISRWLFDVEMILRLKHKIGAPGVSKLVFEEPLEVWIEQGNSKINTRDLYRIPNDLHKIRKHYK